MKLTVTQINWDGKGNNRSFNYCPDADTLDEKLTRIAQAYNLEGGRTKVELDGRDITAELA